MITALTQKRNHQFTFEDLKDLRAEAYVRDSTIDQRDGFGPDIQHRNIERFAQMYELHLGNRWYTEFVSGRTVEKREQFQAILADAKVDLFDVLLVDHTSRFGRNQAECIHYKDELKALGKVVVFVSQGIISGSDRDFLAERINETMDEGYSRNLSRYIAQGLEGKANSGLHVGPAPLGYKSKLENGRERKVVDPETMPILQMALNQYATGQNSLNEVAIKLNSNGYRSHDGNRFTAHSIKDILHNRFYEGKVVFHRGSPETKVIDGIHEVPPEVKELWLKCQQVRQERRVGTCSIGGQPRKDDRHYIFSKVLKCGKCSQPYYGTTAHQPRYKTLRLIHERQEGGHSCNASPKSYSIEPLSQQFNDRVLTHLHLPDDWKEIIIGLTKEDEVKAVDDTQVKRVTQALERTRQLYKWGDLTDDEYRKERVELEKQLKLLKPAPRTYNMPNLDRAAQLLNDITLLWNNQGVTDEQREALIKETFNSIIVDSKQITAIEPKPEYAPLFASIIVKDQYAYCGVNSPPSPPSPTLLVFYHETSI